ncbi:MAG: glycosyltransferase family 2 protein [Parvularculaceae bacterium]
MAKDAGGPLVSVVIVTRDRPTLVARAIVSVFAQTHRPIEVRLVDNQSTTPIDPPPAPNGVEVVRLRAPKRLNASAARNFGAEGARGAFVGFLDDDDFYLPEKLARQVAALEADPSAEFCIIDTERRTPNGVAVMRLNDPSDVYAVLRYRPIHTNSPLIRTDVFRAERFNAALEKYTDLHLTYRLFERRKCVKAKGVGAVWTYDNRADQITRTGPLAKLRDLERSRRNWKIICDDFAHLIGRRNDLRRAYFGKLAVFSLLTFRLGDALRYAARTAPR